MSILDDFKEAVINSRLLTPQQRQAYLDGAGEMPEEYLEQVMEILQGFDKRSTAREAQYNDGVQKALASYKEEIRQLTGISEAKRAELLKQADKMENQLTVKDKRNVTMVGTSA